MIFKMFMKTFFFYFNLSWLGAGPLDLPLSCFRALSAEGDLFAESTEMEGRAEL